MRIMSVNEKSLAQIAGDKPRHVFKNWAKVKCKAGWAEKSSVLADALEALIGALFLDLGYQAASSLIIALFKPILAACRRRGRYSLCPIIRPCCRKHTSPESEKILLYRITAEVGPPP